MQIRIHVQVGHEQVIIFQHASQRRAEFSGSSGSNAGTSLLLFPPSDWNHDSVVVVGGIVVAIDVDVVAVIVVVVVIIIVVSVVVVCIGNLEISAYYSP